MLNTQKLIEDFNNNESLKKEFHTLYLYLLYVCGGDFSLFDNQKFIKI